MAVSREARSRYKPEVRAATSGPIGTGTLLIFSWTGLWVETALAQPPPDPAELEASDATEATAQGSQAPAEVVVEAPLAPQAPAESESSGDGA